jgi:hypothetical protein
VVFAFHLATSLALRLDVRSRCTIATTKVIVTSSATPVITIRKTFMTSSLPLDSASHSLAASNIIYVVGAVLTLASAAMVLYEKNSKNRGIELRWGLTTEIVVVIAAFISLAGTFGAIGFGNTVGKIKDANLATYQKEADVQIAGANQAAMNSLAKAVTAQLDIDKLKPAVSTLQTSQAETSKAVGNLTTARTMRVSASAIQAINKLGGAHIVIHADETDSDAMTVFQQFGKAFRSYAPQPSYAAVIGMPILPSFFVRPGIHIRHEDSPTANAVAATIGAILKSSGIAFDSSIPTPEDIRYLTEGNNWPTGANKVLIVISKRN